MGMEAVAVDDAQWEFLDALLATPSPSGFEARGHRHFVDYVEPYADEVRTDTYGNAVAVHEGDGPAIAFAGHADEIGGSLASVPPATTPAMGTTSP